MPTNSNRPRGREKNITGQGKPIEKRGSGLGTGKVGTTEGRPAPKISQSGLHTSFINTAETEGKRSTGVRNGAKLSLPIIVILIAVCFIFFGKGNIGSLFTGAPEGTSSSSSSSSHSSSSSASLGSTELLQSLLGGSLGSFSSSGVSGGWVRAANTGALNTSVSPEARPKFTRILGDGKDTVTMMVYMCGTDLESKSGMASSDLAEMVAADIADNVNIIVLTGGCKGWKTNGISAERHQIWQVTDRGLLPLEKNMGNDSMTAVDTLTSFIDYCTNRFPANRNMLIFWDHGGGSLSGYGYDELLPNSGSMGLSAIDKALSTCNVRFDMIGFDACLMATAENALMLADHADYLVASEETEPGIGWFYTNFINMISSDTSTPTLEIGKRIVDDFTEQCATRCKGQKTTLSVIDLAEFGKTAPAVIGKFAVSATDLITENQYKTVADARATTREFAASNGIDQIDLIHFALNVGTPDGKALADTLLSAVKYNRVSGAMSNSFGVSIYFPYRKSGSVKNAVRTYQAIGMSNEYGRCIESFVGMEAGGQAVAGGTSNALGSLLGNGGSAASSLSSLLGGGSGDASEAVGSIISSLLGGSFGGFSAGSEMAGLIGSDVLSSVLGNNKATAYLTDNYFDDSALVWRRNASGENAMYLSEEQWDLVHGLDLNVWYDDGEGYIDLGLDNAYEFTSDGGLLGEYDGTWLAVNGQPVAYYRESTFDDGENYVIHGYIPCYINDSRAELIVLFDNADPHGIVSGYRNVYINGETDTVAKAENDLVPGVRIVFVCDYFDYEGVYKDSYMFGEPLTYTGELTVSDVYIESENASAMYRFTDIYNQPHWTPVIPD